MRWLTLLILALLIGLFAACFTLEERERDLGFSQEARLNPWLAAGRVLASQGVHVRYAPTFGQLPQHADVMVLATPLEYLGADEEKTLLDWVHDGGHLVTELQTVYELEEKPAADDSLYQHLGVRLLKRDAAESKALASNPQGNTTLLAQEGAIKSSLDPAYYLAHDTKYPDWQALMGQRAQVMRFALGRGRITVLSDSRWLGNGWLGKADNAALLWRVVDARPGQMVWLIHGQQRPSLFSLLWESASLTLKALALLVLVWLWQVSRRFGPVQPPATTSHRRLSEHLEASGRYLMRHGGLPTLLDASRQRLLTQLQRQHPQWRRLPDAELAQKLGARAGLEHTPILRVLQTQTPDNLLQFAADIRLLNRLRKAL